MRLTLLTGILVLALAAIAESHTLTWNDVANETGYVLQSCSGSCTNTSTAWSDLGTFPANATTGTVTLSALTSYRMRAFNLSGRGGPSNVIFLPDVPGDMINFVIGP